MMSSKPLGAAEFDRREPPSPSNTPEFFGRSAKMNTRILFRQDDFVKDPIPSKESGSLIRWMGQSLTAEPCFPMVGSAWLRLTSRTMLLVFFGSQISMDVAPRDSSRTTTCLR